MTKRPFFILFAAAAMISFPVFAQDAASQALLHELDRAIAGASDAREKAGDFESDTYFPGEWEAAGEQFSQAALLPRNNDAAVRDAISVYKTATDAFDSIFALTVPLYAQAREDEIMELRDILVSERARELFPEYLSQADKVALLALDQYEAEDYYTARDSADRALEMYRCLTTGYEAWLLGWEINEREFDLYDPDNYDRAGEILAGAMDAYNAGDIPAAREDAEEAMLRYRLVLSTGWAEYAEFRSSLAEGERQAALAMRTNVASREFFTMAEQYYKDAHNLFEAEDYEEAAVQFVDAEAIYVIASMNASEKRRLAAAAIREAFNKIEESEEIAQNAEHTIEGGSR